MTAWLGLGANQGDAIAQLTSARQTLARLPTCEVTASSSLYSTAPVGDLDQGRFTNAVCRLVTQLPPGVLLGALHGIEQVAGRRRDQRRFGPRPLDLDLLLYGDHIIRSANLVVPHPRLGERRFVLQPLAEIDAQLMIPGAGSVAAALASCQDQDCERLGSWSLG